MTEVLLGIGSHVDAEHHVRFALTELERDFGPVATSRWGPRTLDIDRLLYGSMVDSALRLPRAGRLVTTSLPEQPGSVVQPQPIAAAE